MTDDRRANGGPLNGRFVDWTADVVTLAAYPGMAYHRTRTADGERVYEWHEREWVSRTVAAIREAVRDASERRLH